MCILAALCLSLLPSGGWAQTEGGFEQLPVLEAKELVPEKLLTGPGVRVENRVPTDGVMGTFTVYADAATYGENAGTY